MWWMILCLCLMFIGGFLWGFWCGVGIAGKCCVKIIEDTFPHLKKEVEGKMFKPNIRNKDGSINMLSVKLK